MEAVRLAVSITPDPLTALVAAMPGWYIDARCGDADPDAFFPRKGANHDDALAICATCPVVDECLAYALELEADDPTTAEGVWGGTTAKQRRALRLAESAA